MHTRRFEPDLASAGAARRFVREVLAVAACQPDTDLAELLVSELATNAITHGEGPFEVLVDPAPRVRISVHDRGTELTCRAPRMPDGCAEHGRGMALVHQLASRWGVERSCRGKTVWFELPES